MLYAEYYLPTYWNRQYELPSFFQDLFCIESSAPKAKGPTGFDDRYVEAGAVVGPLKTP